MKCLQFLLANYNSADHIEILTKSLRAYHPGFSYEILCCDQGSTDSSDEYLASLPEVHMWKLDDRPSDIAYNEMQVAVVDHFGLTPYIAPYFTRKTMQRDYRTTHAAALNFLMERVATPIFATLDTDIEFLGPHWIEPFLLPFLLDSSVGAVGFQEEPVYFEIGQFAGQTLPRLHPCLALWKTAYVWQTKQTWDATNEFDLRLPIIHKTLVEGPGLTLILGDVGYAVGDGLEEQGHKLVRLPPEDFFRSCRHFYGATVKGVYFDREWDDWLQNLQGEQLKPLAEFAELSQHYADFCYDAVIACNKYWKTKNPELPSQSEVPLVFVN